MPRVGEVVEVTEKLKKPQKSSKIAQKIIESLLIGNTKDVFINSLALKVPYDIITKSYSIMGYRYKLRGKGTTVHITSTADNKLMGLAYSSDIVYLQN